VNHTSVAPARGFFNDLLGVRHLESRGEESMTADTGPVAGVRVLDLSRILAAPVATQLMGDLGRSLANVPKRYCKRFLGSHASRAIAVARRRRDLASHARMSRPHQAMSCKSLPFADISVARSDASFSVDLSRMPGATSVRFAVTWRNSLLSKNS
jgi:hypothetical protein